MSETSLPNHSSNPYAATKAALLQSLGLTENNLPHIITLAEHTLNELRDTNTRTTLCGSALYAAISCLCFELIHSTDTNRFARAHKLLDNFTWYLCCHQQPGRFFNKLKPKFGRCQCNHRDRVVSCLHAKLSIHISSKTAPESLFYAISAFLTTFVSRSASVFTRRFVNQIDGYSSRWPRTVQGLSFGDPGRLVHSTLQWQIYLNSPIPLRYLTACLVNAPHVTIPAVLAHPGFISHTTDSFSKFSLRLLEKYSFEVSGSGNCAGAPLYESDVETYVEFWRAVFVAHHHYPAMETMVSAGLGLKLIRTFHDIIRALRNVTEVKWAKELRWELLGGFVYVEKVLMTCRLLARLLFDMADQPPFSLPEDFDPHPSQPENSPEVRALKTCRSLMGGSLCMAPDCLESISSVDDTPFKICGGCQAVRYCSRKCQAAAWVYFAPGSLVSPNLWNLSHRDVCGTIAAVIASPLVDWWEVGFDTFRGVFQQEMHNRNIDNGDIAFLTNQMDDLHNWKQRVQMGTTNTASL